MSEAGELAAQAHDLLLNCTTKKLRKQFRDRRLVRYRRVVLYRPQIQTLKHF